MVPKKTRSSLAHESVSSSPEQRRQPAAPPQSILTIARLRSSWRKDVLIVATVRVCMSAQVNDAPACQRHDTIGVEYGRQLAGNHYARLSLRTVPSARYLGTLAARHRWQKIMGFESNGRVGAPSRSWVNIVTISRRSERTRIRTQKSPYSATANQSTPVQFGSINVRFA